MGLPAEIKPIWRTVQVIKITLGLDGGLKLFIIGPFLFESFKHYTTEQSALFYSTFLWAVFYGLIALLEIPTGALADVLGRVKIVIASLVLSVLYGLSLAVIPLLKGIVMVFVVVCFSRILSALSFTLFNGSFSAWIIDSVREVNPQFGYERILGKSHAYYLWSTIVGALLGVTAYLLGVPHIAFLACSFLSLGCITYCMGMMEEPKNVSFVDFPKLTRSLLFAKLAATIRTGFKVGRQVPVLWWILGAYATYNLLINVVDFLWPVAMSVQFGTKKWTLEWYLMAFGVPLTSVIGAHLLAFAGNRHQRKTGNKMTDRALRIWLIGSLLLASLPILILGMATYSQLISFPLFASCIFLLEATYGVISPCVDTMLNNYIPEANAQERATILSLGSMVRGILVLLLIIPSSGGSGMKSPIGWMIPAIILFLLALLFNNRIKVYNQRRETS